MRGGFSAREESGGRERPAQSELRAIAFHIGVAGAPIEFRHDAVEIAEGGAAHRIAHAEFLAMDEIGAGDGLVDMREGRLDLLHLPSDIVGTLLLGFGQTAVMHDVDGGIEDAIAQDFPQPDGDALGECVGDQFRARADAVDILGDDRGIVDRPAVVEEQGRDLGQRIGGGDARRGIARAGCDEFAGDAFLGDCHARLAYIGTAVGT